LNVGWNGWNDKFWSSRFLTTQCILYIPILFIGQIPNIFRSDPTNHPSCGGELETLRPGLEAAATMASKVQRWAWR
jgi:hypothetical protein